ncbi:MAG: sulfite exporter TauE/SafE family protein [bacterium]|nr:sulfite exporter TauE/SafE family protein [bacterium]
MILGYLLAIGMGCVLGLLGGGGSILTVPILVYLFGISPILATGYSLFVVGLTSAFGVVSYLRQGIVDIRLALTFSIPALVGVLVSRRYVLPALPSEIETVLGVLSKDTLVMIAFAFLVIVTAAMMFRRQSIGGGAIGEDLDKRSNVLVMGFVGVIVGLLTGFVGAGGGFMIVPVLVYFGRLGMREAVATSLLIMTINSLVGFGGDLSIGVHFDWVFLAKFMVFTSVGMRLGIWFNSRIPVAFLKRGFSYFVLVMGFFIVLKELI